MKIIYVTHQFLPDYVAGTEILTYETAKEFGRRGHDVSVFTGFRGPSSPERPKPYDSYDYDGIPVYRFGYCKEEKPGLGTQMRDEYLNPRAEHYFKETLRAVLPDLVHIYHLQRLSVSIVGICSELKIPVVFTATDYWILCPICQLLLPDGDLCKGPDEDMLNCLRHMAEVAGKGMIFRHVPDRLLSIPIKIIRRKTPADRGLAFNLQALLKRPESLRSAMAMVNRLLVPTDFMKRMLSGFGIDPRKIMKIPFGVEQREGPPPPKMSSPQLRVGFIGTLYDHKGAHVLCEALRLVPQESPLSVKIYGSQELFPDYVKRLKAIVGNDPRVCFCGTFPPDRLHNVLRDLDVLVVPSLWYENTPLVIHGAQAAHVPVVATDLGGMSEVVVNGENGFLFERGNSRTLAQIIERLCRDRQLLESLSGRARAPLSMADYADRLETVYGEVSAE